jgi:hypothetical protein
MAGLSDDMNLRYFAQECCCSPEALLEDAYKVSRLSCTDGSRSCRRIDFLPTGRQHAGEADERNRQQWGEFRMDVAEEMGGEGREGPRHLT